MMEIHGLMWDSTTRLPFTPPLEALYVNGAFASPASYGRGRVYIDVNGTAPEAAFFRDIEPGNGTPAGFGAWLQARYAAGKGWGGGYCDRSDLPGMIASAGSRPWSLWLATLDGNFDGDVAAELGLPDNVTLVAVQAFGAAHLGFNADMSVVTDADFWAERALPHGALF